MTRVLFSFAAALLLSGCATISSKAPALGHGDTSGFDPKGTTVEVVYDLTSQAPDGETSYAVTPDTPPQKVAEIRAERADEIYTLLKGYGFQPAQGGKADFRVRVVEGGETTQPDSVLMLLLSSFSMLIIPHTYTGTSGYGYELWAGDSKVHGIDTRTEKKKVFGVVGLPLLAINATGSVDRQARVESHTSVLSSWIEQGAFE